MRTSSAMVNALRMPAALACVSVFACSAGVSSIPPAITIPVPDAQEAGGHAGDGSASASHASGAANAARAPETFDVAAIDAWVAQKVAEQHLVGLSLAVVREGKTVLAKGYGLANREQGIPASPDTPFAIGSITKQFTCASALLLEQQGKLSLEDKVAKYYPELPRARDISLADLGAHLSGYPDYYPLDFFDSRMQKPILADDLIHRYAKEPLDFAPRARYSYSNTGFVILGRVIEKVSGRPLPKLLEEKILGPLGMTHTSFAPPASTPGLAVGYESFALSDPAPAPREPEAWMYAAGALYASATDLTKWDLGLIEGKVLHAAAYAKMTTPRLLQDKRSSSYGCGIHIEQMRGETVLMHGGEVNGFLAENAIVPRTRSAVVLLTNSQFGDPDGIYRTILGLVVKDGADSARPPKVRGASIKEAGLALLKELQHGHLDRTKLGAEFSMFMTDAKVSDAARRLAPLGDPTSTEVDGPYERGGMEVSRLHWIFGSTKIVALMYRSPDGIVQEFLVSKP